MFTKGHMRFLAAVVAVLCGVVPWAALAFENSAVPGPSRSGGGGGLLTTGGTMTGQVVSDGVACDISTAATTNSDYAICPAAGKGLLVNATAGSTVAEQLFMSTISDTGASCLGLINPLPTDGSWAPYVDGYTTTANAGGISLRGGITGGNDSGTIGVINIQAARMTACGVQSASVTTRPLIQVYNHNTAVLDLMPAGDIKLPAGATRTRGTITLAAGTGTATVISGAICVCTDTTANASVRCAVSSTTLTATGTGTDVIAYHCL